MRTQAGKAAQPPEAEMDAMQSPRTLEVLDNTQIVLRESHRLRDKGQARIADSLRVSTDYLPISRRNSQTASEGLSRVFPRSSQRPPPGSWYDQAISGPLLLTTRLHVGNVWPDMGATGQGQPDAEHLTLGALLYSDKTKTPVSEREWVGLVESIAKGNQQALHALYERAHRVVFTLIVRITGSRPTAEELTVDVFHDVWRRAAGYDPANGSVLGWIMNQARSRAIDRLRFEQRKKRVGDLAAGPPPGSPADDPQATLDVGEEARLLRDALTVLTPNERQVIEIAFFSELTYHEVARRLNQPVGTVKTRIRSGLSKLKQALAGPVGAP